MLHSPLRFHPFLRPMVWGGRDLSSLGKILPTAEAYGESWEVSDHPSHASVVAEGPFAGNSLRYLMEHHAKELLGAAAQKHVRFPWLIKFLDAQDWLSVQVHPDEEAVKTLWPGEGPKTEAWYILDAKPESKIYAGLLPGVGPKEFRAALENGTVADCLPFFTPKPGDCLFLPAGTVHAVGGGVLIAEIQQTSDATFRLFDWNRKDAKGQSRKLHIEEGMQAIHWEQGIVKPIRANGPGRLVFCRYFELDYVTAKDFPKHPGRLQSFMALSGEGRWMNGSEVKAGQVWVLPAACEAHLEGSVAGLLAVQE